MFYFANLDNTMFTENYELVKRHYSDQESIYMLVSK